MRTFGLIVLGLSASVLSALTLGRLARRVRVPVSVVFLVGAALASDVWPSLGSALTPRGVEWIGSAALIVILFDGGLSLGWRRVASVAPAVGLLGVLATLVAAGVVTLAAHLLLGLAWAPAGVLGVALAPTDPAVVFSALGATSIGERTRTIIESESGANDPVAIALMTGVIAAATSGSDWLPTVAGGIARELFIGFVIGLLAGWLARRPLQLMTAPTDVLQPLAGLAAAGVAFGAATVAGGSGFLAVFVTALLIGDAEHEAVADLRVFQAELAGLAEVVVFVALGLTVDVGGLTARDAGEGLVIVAILLFVARPPFVIAGLSALRVPLADRVFIAWAGMRGAVPILLGALALAQGVDGAARDYRLIFVVVTASVLIQGLTLEPLAGRLASRQAAHGRRSR